MPVVGASEFYTSRSLSESQFYFLDLKPGEFHVNSPVRDRQFLNRGSVRMTLSRADGRSGGADKTTGRSAFRFLQ